MCRKTFSRGFATLALVTILALAGAQPAAAADPGFANRLANLWSAVTGGEPIKLWNTVIGWLGGTEKATYDEVDRGAGSDPNGEDAVQVPVLGGDPH